MGAAEPADVADGDILVVAEEEGVRNVGVAEGGEAADIEAGEAALETIAAVGARNSEVVGAVVFVKIDVFGAEAEAGEADVAINKNARRDGVGSADGGGLDETGGASGLAAVEGVAAGGTEGGGIEDETGGEAVAGEEGHLLDGVVVHFEVGVVAVELVGSGSGWRRG